MDVVLGEPVLIELRRDLTPVAAHIGECRLRRLLHHVAELAGDRQLAGTGHRGRLDEKHVAAGWSPSKTGRDTGNFGPPPLLSEDAAAAEQLAGSFGRDPRL